MLSTGDLLRRGNPGLRGRPRHASRAAAVKTRSRDQSATRTDDGNTAAQAELLTFVDGSLNELAGLCQRDVAHVYIAHVSGIELLRSPLHSVEEAIVEAFGHKPSMLQDVLARRRTEIDVLNGGIAAQGRRVGVATPGHDAMDALVHGLESSWS